MQEMNQAPTAVAQQSVVVKDVDISFGQMVVLLVKLAIASIPATIILFIVFGILLGIMTAFFGGLGALMS